MMATRFRTTDGTIALVNLDAQIESLERQAARGRLLSRWSADLVDRLTLRPLLEAHHPLDGRGTAAQHIFRCDVIDGAEPRWGSGIGDIGLDRIDEACVERVVCERRQRTPGSPVHCNHFIEQCRHAVLQKTHGSPFSVELPSYRR